MTILGISRSPRLATASADWDAALFMAVASRMKKGGNDVSIISEDVFIDADLMEFDLIFSMARSRDVLESLKKAEMAGKYIVNSPEAVDNLDFLAHSVDEGISRKDFVRFEGIIDSDFFTCSFEADDSRIAELKASADFAAEAAGLAVYGGWAKVCHNGTTEIVVLEDWPDFHENRKQAAIAIATTLKNQYNASSETARS